MSTGEPPCWQHRGPTWTVSDGHESTTKLSWSEVFIDVAFEDLKFNESWVTTTRDRLANFISARMLVALEKGRKNRGCKPLADLAEVLLNAEKKLKGVVVDSIEQVLPQARLKVVSRIQRKFVEMLVNQALSMHLPDRVKTAARVLQGVGIWMCAIRKLNPDQCACWVQLRAEIEENAIRATVDRAFDKLLPQQQTVA